MQLFSIINSNKKNIRLSIGIAICLIGIIIFYLNFRPVRKIDYNIAEEKLLTLTNYLSDDPTYIKGSKHIREGFRLQLNGYPGIYFENHGVLLAATEWGEFNTQVKYRDTISIKVIKKDFEKYYLYRDSLSPIQKLTNHNDSYNFYSLVFKNKEYVTDIYEAAKDVRNDSLMPSFIVGITIILIGCYIIFYKK
jgi:hypothetical protein